MDPEACLFAKENLLNLSFARLPDSIDRVLWIDADVILLADDYVDRLTDALDRHSVVQGFETLKYLGPDGVAQTGWRESLVHYNNRMGLATGSPSKAYPGLAWAASRELLTNIGGLYDRAITGASDVAWSAANYGDWDLPHLRQHWPPAMIADVLAYMRRVNPLITSIGHVASQGVHLYHGRIAHRQYVQRHRVLEETQFDPQRHLDYSKNGTLRWSAEAPGALKRAVCDYMHGRREDE